MFLYVLELVGGNFYVGTTTNVKRRVKQHKYSRTYGAAWTKRHRPVAKPTARYPPQELACGTKLARLEEDKKVVELMTVHGIDKVRGGSYSSPFARVNIGTLGEYGE